MAKNYNFGEKKTEKINGVESTVIITPKYETSKQAVITLLESEVGKDLSEKDFWIQKNQSKDKKYTIYSSLIITHDALLKINAALPEGRRFDQKFCSEPIPFSYANKVGMYMTYRDTRDGMFEIGEITTDSCKNDYPFAMLLKRTFDRVVKRKANLFGIYSDAEEFCTNEEECDITKPEKPSRKPATTSIPKEEDDTQVNVDPETGEILESETKAESTPKKKVEEKEAAQTEEELKELSDVEREEIERALNHELEGLTKKDGKGFSIKRLVTSDMLTDGQKLQRLKLFEEKGTERDKISCEIVMAAIDTGYVSFENSKF